MEVIDVGMEEDECKAARFFNGTMKLTVCEAVDLRPTDCATRHQVGLGLSRNLQAIDPYVIVDVDDAPVARTQTRLKTCCPSWLEDFSVDVHGGHTIGITVFHSAVIPPDVFVANCSVAFENFVEKPASDIWVYLLLVRLKTIVFGRTYVLLQMFFKNFFLSTRSPRCVGRPA